MTIIDRLEELAEKATPGLWTSDGFAMEDDAQVRVCTTNGTPTYYHTCAHIAECGTNYTGDPDVDDLRPGEPKIGVIQAEKNAAHIAACSPEVILALCRVARSSEAFMAKLVELTPAIEGAFAFQQNHGFPYSGPNWVSEKAALTDALSALNSMEDGNGST